MRIEMLPTRVVVGVSFADDPYQGVVTVAENEVHLVEQALDYGEKTGAELSFVSCLEGPNEPIPGHDTWLHDILRERLGHALDELVARAKERGVRARQELVEGAAARALLAVARQQSAGLIMVAPRRQGSSVLDRFLHGSTAERLLRHAEMSLWIVHPDATPQVKTVFVPVDFSPVSERAVGLARRVHETWGAKVFIIHAIEYPREIALRRLPQADESIRAYREEVHDDVARKFDKLLGGDRGWCHVLLSHDWVVRSLPELVVRENADLVIMGSVGRGGVSGFFIGNTAEKLFRLMECSTWVMKPEGWNTGA